MNDTVPGLLKVTGPPREYRSMVTFEASNGVSVYVYTIRCDTDD